MKYVLIEIILFYKRYISPLTPETCKYTPTCSIYTAQAIYEYGCIIGVLMGVWRILRCNPFSKGGYDPVKVRLKGDVKWVL